MQKTLGQRIKELRTAADLSLRELGEKVDGKSAAFLSDIELGHRFPSDDVLEKLAAVLKSSVDELRQYDQRPPTKEMQDLIAKDTDYGFVFRTMVDRVKKGRIPPAEILRRFPRENVKEDQAP